MGKYLILLAFLFFSANIGTSPCLFPQQTKKSKKALSKTIEKTISLVGKSRELVIIMGFPDRDQSYPVLKNKDEKFPLPGAFPDGTLLTDYINSHGGSIPVDLWYKPALNHFFSVYSGRRYDIQFDFLKRSDNKVYTTKDNLQTWIDKAKSADDVIWNNWLEMTGQAAEQIYKDNKNAFDEVKAIHFVFTGINKNEFNTLHGGTVQWDTEIKGPDNNVYYRGPVSIQRDVNAIAHERMHILGKLAGAPKGFIGFPDRGFDLEAGEGHSNLLYGYDMMYHNSTVMSQHSLYGLPPVISHDLIFLGWIRPEEILTINSENYKQYNTVKLSDVNYPLSDDKIKQGFRRIVKIMIKEKYSAGLDEYFLLEFHNATEFDKNSSNYDEYPLGGYNKGMLIWHVKEITPLVNVFSDNLIDLETAVPYNGFYGNPLPKDDYPRDYKRPKNWNGVFSGENDYLDDDKLENVSGGQWIYKYLPDGGRSYWEITTKGLDWQWYPKDKKIFPRLQSLRSDFFSDKEVKGHISNKFSDASLPSTKSWGGSYGSSGNEKPAPTHIAVTDIKQESNYMSARVFFNYWEGNLTSDSEISGNAAIGSNLIVPENVSLNIKPGTQLNFLNDSKLIVKGTLRAKGTAKRNIVFNSDDPSFNQQKAVESSAKANVQLLNVRIGKLKSEKVKK